MTITVIFLTSVIAYFINMHSVLLQAKGSERSMIDLTKGEKNVHYLYETVM